jgi:hypothetical protein
VGVFGKGGVARRADTGVREGALEQAQSALAQARSGAAQPEKGVAGWTARLVDPLMDIGIDGRPPLPSAAKVGADALAKASSPEAAVNALIRQHVRAGAAGGFVTGLGGFVTMPVALPVNVVEFYIVATRMVASIAHVRGYDLTQQQIRTAVMLTLVGADADDLLKKAGVVVGEGRLVSLAAARLPGSALMMLNKAIGFRLVQRAGEATLTRFGKAVPVIGGVIGAGLDGYMLGRIADSARREFPRVVAG